MIYLNNYFTSIPLFIELRAYNFGAIGTIRPHNEFPHSLAELKNRFTIKLKWNTLLAAVVNKVLYLAWQDNNIILSLSNIYIVDKGDDFIEKARKRPIKTLINRRIMRKVFRDNYIKEL
jgi:hypothetical protein